MVGRSHRPTQNNTTGASKTGLTTHDKVVDVEPLAFGRGALSNRRSISSRCGFERMYQESAIRVCERRAGARVHRKEALTFSVFFGSRVSVSPQRLEYCIVPTRRDGTTASSRIRYILPFFCERKTQRIPIRQQNRSIRQSSIPCRKFKLNPI